MSIVKFLGSIILFIFAILFVLFSIQNNQIVEITLLPNLTYNIEFYIIVLSCFFLGFIIAVVITRFEYIKTQFSLSKAIKKLKTKSKKQSKYIEE